MKIEELQKACKILGLDSSQFLKEEELEKASDNLNYKELFENQKSLNEQLIKGIANIPGFIQKSFEDFQGNLPKNDDKIKSLEGKIEEISKSLDSLSSPIKNIAEKLHIMEESPARKKKAFTNLNAVEKGINPENQAAAVNTFSLNDRLQVKRLKSFLGEKTMECLEKGINNSIYERASMQLDSSKTISMDLRKALFDKEKINIEN